MSSNNSSKACKFCGDNHKNHCTPPPPPPKKKPVGGSGGGGDSNKGKSGGKKVEFDCDCNKGKNDKTGGKKGKDPPNNNEPPGKKAPPPPSGAGDGGCPPPGSPSDDPCANYVDFIPPHIANILFYVALVVIILACAVLVYCRGAPSSNKCFGSFRSSCRRCNGKFMSALGGKKGGCSKSTTKGGRFSSAFLDEQYENFQKRLKNPACLAQDIGNCPGILNYAGILAGARIITIRDTLVAQNIAMCKCKDADRFGQQCNPKSGPCSVCKCTEAKADLLLQEDAVVAGRCFAFSGVGKILVGLFYPIIVTGITLHHPARSELLPGRFNSAPKTFELWVNMGYHNETDKKPFKYGTFNYAETDPPIKLYEVENLSTDFYEAVQFNFLTNHGNPNYTAVYKVEVHGLVDQKSMMN